MADRQDYERDRDFDRDRERGGENDRRDSGAWERRGEGARGYYGQGPRTEWEREREGEWGRGNRFERQNDWNREIWGEPHPRRPDWDREGVRGRGEGRRDYSSFGYAGRTGGSADWNRTSDREGQIPFGAGQRGFGTGPSYYSGSSSYYGGGQGYGGGTGTYGQEGRFAGRGPKGYQRSDERIREDVCERLTQDPRVDASDIEIQVQNGEVTLSGTVDDRESKRTAEDVAESISGVKDVHNQIRVQIRIHATNAPGQGGAGTPTGSTEKTTTGTLKRS
jgi:hypothetical protein